MKTPETPEPAPAEPRVVAGGGGAGMTRLALMVEVVLGRLAAIDPGSSEQAA